jgi:TonB family protein
MINPAPVLIFALLVAASTSAQTASSAATPDSQTPPATAAPADPPMPKDPNALMQLAARVNGLGSPDMKPWHLKANYQTFDANGKPKDQGVFEEWWASPDKYKISYTSASFNQVQYRKGKDTLVTGDTDWPSLPEKMVERYFVDPFSGNDEEMVRKYQALEVNAAKVHLRCVRSTDPGGSVVLSTFCFEKHIPAIRVEMPFGGMGIYFNDIVRSKGQYVAEQVTAQRSGKPFMTAQLVTLEPLPTLEGAEFTAPASAVTPKHPWSVAPGVIAGYKVGGDDIKYPPDAKAAHLEGDVVLRAVITKAGTVEDIKAISGPPILQQAAISAVYTWRYSPYLRDGQPVEVETEVKVDFTLGR